eukprot:CAMPEP_0117862714 /NCGR_PEP_ID=MMETSP0950-20121206/5145_1 /TAXON_ID=44440 /ORGANISM="Chattonella subsalsa, Strain CCMP2191" /LENGTH=757 /DNA_ID=CAMNT_0005713335 /DNA_START=122 /DNA_END=2392 /DNA_ORIENTATION=-
MSNRAGTPGEVLDKSAEQKQKSFLFDFHFGTQQNKNGQGKENFERGSERTEDGETSLGESGFEQLTLSNFFQLVDPDERRKSIVQEVHYEEENHEPDIETDEPQQTTPPKTDRFKQLLPFFQNYGKKFDEPKKEKDLDDEIKTDTDASLVENDQLNRNNKDLFQIFRPHELRKENKGPLQFLFKKSDESYHDISANKNGLAANSRENQIGLNGKLKQIFQPTDNIRPLSDTESGADDESSLDTPTSAMSDKERRATMVAGLAAQAMLYKHRYKNLQSKLDLREAAAMEEKEVQQTMDSLQAQKAQLEKEKQRQDEQIRGLERTINVLKIHQEQSKKRTTSLRGFGTSRHRNAIAEFGKGSQKKLTVEFFKEGFDMGRNIIFQLLKRAADENGKVCGCLPVGEGFRHTFSNWFQMVLHLAQWHPESAFAVKNDELCDFLQTPPVANPATSWTNPFMFMLWLLEWPFVGLALILLNLVRCIFSIPIIVILFTIGMLGGFIWLVYSMISTSAYIAFVYMFDLRETIHTHEFKEPLISMKQIIGLLRNFRNRVTIMWVVWHLMDVLTDVFFAVKLSSLYPSLATFAFCSIIISMSARCAIGTYLRLNLRLENNNVDKMIAPLVSLLVSVIAPSAVVELHEILALEKASFGTSEEEMLQISSMTYFGLIAEVVMEHLPAGVVQSYYYAWHHSFTAFDIFNTTLTFAAAITVIIVLISGTTFFSGTKSYKARIMEIIGAILGFPLPLLTTIFIGLMFICSVIW